MNGCQATTRNGRQCRFRVAPGAEYCLNHQPGADLVSAATRASQASALARRGPSEHLLEMVLSFTDRASIQVALDTVVRLTLSGRISHERAGTVLRACSIAVRNFDLAGDTLAGPKPQQHDWFPYFEKLTALLHTVDPLLDEASKADLEALESLA